MKATTAIVQSVNTQTAERFMWSAVWALLPIAVAFGYFAISAAANVGVLCFSPTYVIPGKPIPPDACVNDFHKFALFISVNAWSLFVSAIIGPAIKGGVDAIKLRLQQLAQQTPPAAAQPQP